MGSPDSIWGKVTGFPWALIAFFGLAIYAVAERITGGMAPGEFVDAMTGSALLAIGHGIHHGGTIVARAQGGAQRPSADG